MRVVYRYDLAETPDQDVELTAGAQILLVMRQIRAPHNMSLWALVDTDNPIVNRRILWRGTGTADAIPEAAIFLNTTQEADGFVWHFFDGGES
jgi:hypothetical protein